MKLNALSFALAGGVFGAVLLVLVTIASRLGVAGALELTNGLTRFLGYYGYGVSWLGLVMSVIIGFVKGFLIIGFFGILYNSMVKK